jgi:hypothetical protein
MIGAVDQKALEALFVYSWPGAVVYLSHLSIAVT